MISGTLTLLWAYLQTCVRRRFTTRQQLEAWQDVQVKKHLQKILPRSRFYQSHFSGLSLDSWRTFPVIDKAAMMENFDTLNTAGISKEQALAMAMKAEKTRDFTQTLQGITIGLSSGTSGHRGLFAVSDKERFLWAGTFLAKILPRSLFQKHRLALFLRSNSNLYTSTRKRRIQFSYFDLLNPFEIQVERLNKYQPTTLLAPPSMLRFLADAKINGSLKITPEKIISIAEVLDPTDKAYIESGFKLPIHQVYQCTEGFLGATCRHGTLHLNEDQLVVQKEYLDSSQTKFIPIITDFRRTVQPIIRYRLNDILTESKQPCPCGSPFTALEMVEGRCDDIFYFQKEITHEEIPIFPDFIRRAIISSSPSILEYSVVQKSPHLVNVYLRISGGDRAAIEEDVRNQLWELCDQLHCTRPTIECFEGIFKPSDKKLRRVKREYSL